MVESVSNPRLQALDGLQKRTMQQRVPSGNFWFYIHIRKHIIAVYFASGSVGLELHGPRFRPKYYCVPFSSLKKLKGSNFKINIQTQFLRIRYEPDPSIYGYYCQPLIKPLKIKDSPSRECPQEMSENFSERLQPTNYFKIYKIWFQIFVEMGWIRS